MGEIQDLQKLIEDFAKERDWEKYHTAKNLVLALGSEVGELQAEFRWLNDKDNLSEKKLKAIEDELADISIFLFRLAQILDININHAIKSKLTTNTTRKVYGPNFLDK